ncbi:hypothetical protein BRADI_2g47275v3, partial [Brachypodium distachyon]
MATGSTSSSYRVPTRCLPIIKCPCCVVRDVKKYTTNTDLHGNKGRDFYKCPNHKAGKGGCDFWKWGDEYEAYLFLHGILPNLESDNYVESKMGM